jgi:hypothetical protein
MRRLHWSMRLAVLMGLVLGTTGCQNLPWLQETSDFTHGPAPLRTPGPGRNPGSDRYIDNVNGGELFKMYCLYCHNWRPITERPFSNYQNVMAHMRVRANLTGDEYEILMDWLRHMQDVPAPTQRAEPSPKRLIYSQPISELRPPKDYAETYWQKPAEAPAGASPSAAPAGQPKP